MLGQLLCIAMFACISMLAQDAPPQNDLQALIQEVRTLRSTLDRTTFIGLRVQLVLHRLGQQQHAFQQARDIALRSESQISFMKSRREQLERMVVEADQLKAGPENPRKAQFELQAKMARSEYESFPRQVQEAETASLNAQQNLRTEQAKLDDLNRQLDELEKRLAEISK